MPLPVPLRVEARWWPVLMVLLPPGARQECGGTESRTAILSAPFAAFLASLYTETQCTMKRLNDEGGALQSNAGASLRSCPQSVGLCLFRVPTHQLANLQTTGQNLDCLLFVMTQFIENCDEGLEGAAWFLLRCCFWHDARFAAAPSCGP